MVFLAVAIGAGILGIPARFLAQYIAQTESYKKSYEFFNNKMIGLHEEFSLEKEKEYLDKYYQSMDFNTALETDTFTTIDEIKAKRITGLEGFDEIKINDKTIYQLLDKEKGSGNLEEVKTIVTDALKLTEETQKALDDYAYQAAAFNQLIKTPEFNSHALEKRLQALSEEIESVFNNQKTQEIKALEDKKTDLSKHLGLSDKETDKVLKMMEEQINNSYKENIKEFMKPLQKSHNKLHDNMQRERDRVNFLAALYHTNSTMKKQIDELAKHLAKKRNPGQDAMGFDGASIESGEGEAEIDFANQSILFKGIELEDLKILKTISGTTIEKLGEKGDSKYKIELPGLFSSILHGWNKNINRKKDIDSLVRALRADGIKKITLSVQNNDPERSAELGRILYQAAIEAGYDPSDVTIKVNGEVRPTLSSDEDKDKDNFKKGKGLFDELRAQLDGIHKQAEIRINNRKDIFKAESESGRIDKAFKDELKTIKEQSKGHQVVLEQNMPKP